VPVGGAADCTSFALGNALVGNPAGAAALEITLSGPVLVADAPIACVVFGASFDLASERRRFSPGKTFTLDAGEELRIGGTDNLPRGYFCIRGGLHVPEVLGSRSGLEPLQAGDALACHSATTGCRWFESPISDQGHTLTLRALPGRQADWFADAEFYSRPYNVSRDSDRMGLRLRGAPLDVPQRELVSEPVCPGTVQVTRDGQCIVLGVDGQTIGGYPKIAQLIAADVDKLGRLRPDQTVTFKRVSLEEAEIAYRTRQAELCEWLIRLQTVANR
jgi:biotin-dependent carboxylase-like uncharacterized protein